MGSTRPEHAPELERLREAQVAARGGERETIRARYHEISAIGCRVRP